MQDATTASTSADVTEGGTPAKRAVVPGLCGLTNIGNTCYMNSTLQCLSHTSPLTQLLLEQRGEKIDEDEQGHAALTCAYRTLLHQMWGGSAVVTPSAFKATLCRSLPQFDGSAQHDSPEFLGGLLNCLHEEVCACGPGTGAARDAAPGSYIHDVFAGSLRNTIHCPGCNSDFTKSELFLCLPLPLPGSDLRALYVHVLEASGAACVRHGLRLPWWLTVGDVMARLAELLVEPLAPAYLVAISSHRVRRILPTSCHVSDIPSHDQLYALVAEPACGACKPAPPLRPAEERQVDGSAGARLSACALHTGSMRPEALGDAQTCGLAHSTELSLPGADTASVVTAGQTALRFNVASCDGAVDSKVARLQEAALRHEPPGLESQEHTPTSAAAEPADSVPSTPRSTMLDEAPPADDVVILLPQEGAVGAAVPLSAAIALPTPDAAVALPPREDVIALPPPDEATAPGTAGVPYGPAPFEPSEEDVQQVACVCDATEEVARRALAHASGSLDRAVMLILENPGALAVPAAPTGASAGGIGGGSSIADGIADVAVPDKQVEGEDTAGVEANGAATCAALALPEEGVAGPTVAADQGALVASAAALPTGEAGTSGPQQTLAEAVAIAHVRRVVEALAAGADACATGTDGSPLLHAVFAGGERGRLSEKQSSTIKLLLEARADVDVEDRSGRRLSHRLAEHGADALLAELRMAGSLDLEIRDSLGQTLLHKSAASGCARTTTLLLEWGAEREAADAQHRTPAALAARLGHEEVLDELLERPRLLPVVHRVPNEGAAPRGTSAVDSAAAADSDDAKGAQAAKEAGNACLKAGDYPGAIEQYTLAIGLLKNDASTLTADCYNNRAAVHVQLRNYEDVVADTTECLKRTSGNGKALVRRAQAYQQLEKLKAAFADITAAMRCDSLSQSFVKIARTVHREVRTLLLEDGVDVSSLDLEAPPPIIGAGLRNAPRSRYTFLASPFLVEVPRSRTPSGRELYALTWRHVAGAAEPLPDSWSFELRTVCWDAEDEGRRIPCDDFAAELPAGTALAVEWQALPEALHRTSAADEHASVREVQAEEARKVTLQSCLEALTEARTLSEDDAWHCPKCQKPQLATICTAIERLPKVLVVQLKRFHYTARRRGKISCLVDFPICGLDLGPWCLASEPPAFDLFAVVNHIGGFGGGHYTANARPSSDMQGRDPHTWHHFDDSLCKPVSEDQRLTQDAYILFYAQGNRVPSDAGLGGGSHSAMEFCSDQVEPT